MASISQPLIPEFYKGKDVFITGATGFMGKVLVEKLLRSCSEIGRIFVLMRSKGGLSPQERLEELLSTQIFRSTHSTKGKVVALEGDLTLPDLGLTARDKDLLLDNTQLIFHSAAIVKFDEPLKSSMDMNVLGTRRLLRLCQCMKKLKVFVHISTAYCNCDKTDVSEIIYSPPFDPQNVIDAVRWMKDDMIEAITGQLLGTRPNMYTFTKALAETLVVNERGNVPVAIVRPSIVTAAWKEPIPGWVDNINGPTGLLVASGKGLLRSMLADPDKAADLVPVDTVINTMIVVAWHTATRTPKGIPVYHCTSGTISRLTWGDVERVAYPYLLTNPMPHAVRFPGGSFKKSKLLNALSMFLQHRCLAQVYDVYLWLCGRKPKMFKLFNKLYKVMVSLEYFTTHEWKFHCGNILILMKQLSPEDRKLFSVDLRSIDWGSYFKNYVLGARKFILKDDPTTVYEARLTLRRLYIYEKLGLLAVLFFVGRLIAGKLHRKILTTTLAFYSLLSPLFRHHPQMSLFGIRL
ncbi:fatty acyl-CoA reductase 1-like [Ornithodoros turicata]|uniref:fatty acyl-CoA reductase 1-like n=1 Tax=Ornithodoros turicata TaxID=34597 RepID=UPI00313A3628